MTGPVSHAPEVAAGADQPLAQVLLPDPVDQDPGGEGVLGTRNPAGQGQPPSAAVTLGRVRDMGSASFDNPLKCPPFHDL